MSKGRHPLLLEGVRCETTTTLPPAQAGCMSPSPNWYGINGEGGQPEYHYGDGGDDAVAWLEDGRWQQPSFSLDLGPWQQIDLGEHATVDEALDRADLVMDIEHLVIPLRDNDHGFER